MFLCVQRGPDTLLGWEQGVFVPASSPEWWLEHITDMSVLFCNGG